jgi:hypothetical protein
MRTATQPRTYREFINFFTKELGLKEITSTRQKTKKTIVFEDLQTGATYSFFATGYFRRGTSSQPPYQLNKGSRNPYFTRVNGKRVADYNRMLTEAIPMVEKYRTSFRGVKDINSQMA